MTIAPTLIQLTQSIRVAGIATRTRNADEMGSGGKIGPLWERFRAEKVYATVPGNDPQSPVYGVYTGYESDHTGAFNVTAGVRLQPSAQTAPGEVRIEAGDYLVFETQGPMPDCVIAAWQQVWHYFSSTGQAASAGYQRCYTSDFEEVTDGNGVRLHIAVKRS